MSSNNNNNKSASPDRSARRSSPIPIANNRNGRGRSASVSSSASSGSMSPTSELPTPLNGLSPRVTVPSPGSSPILSYFLAQSPTKSQTLPFRKFGPAPVFEEDETTHSMPPVAHHARRASMTVADRFNQTSSNNNNNTALPESHVERGTGLLRRLSLSTAPSTFSKPPMAPEVPPNTAVSPTGPTSLPPYPRDAKHRRATTSASARSRRAPSPMGERILKGHFDGFN